ncbi:DnaB-like helicase N-terminal domain-containing protein, partial [Streptomyces sp. NPDC055144]
MDSNDNEDGSSAHDLRAEKAVLRAMLQSSNAIADIVELLYDDDFYQPAHAHLYLTLLDLYGRGEPTDLVAVVAHLTKEEQLDQAGGAPCIREISQGCAPKSSWTRNAERVRATAMLRRLRQATARIDNLVADVSPDAADRLADTAQNEILAATLRRGLPPAYSLGEILESTLDEVEALSPDRAIGLPTGFTDFDTLTGGLVDGQLIVVAG